jgi:hypothetical protein
MKTKETSRREQAIAWWNKLEQDEKMDLCMHYDWSLKLLGRLASSLTGREIEAIWKEEVEPKILADSYHNSEYLPAKKQFTEFNQEAVLAYIAKFKPEHLSRLFETVYNAIPNDKKWDGIDQAGFYMDICRAYNGGKQNMLDVRDKGIDASISSDNYFQKEFFNK